MLKILTRIILFILSAVSRIVPRNQNIWVFGSRFGRKYDENSKYFFEYVHYNVDAVKAIWLTRNKEVYQHLSEKKLNVHYSYSFWGFFYSLICKVVCISVCLSDVNKFVVSGARVIQLWHGTPMRDNDLGDLGEDYEMVVVASKEFTEEQLLGAKDKFKFVLTGYPKNDGMITGSNYNRIEKLRNKYVFNKVVMYLPTHRQRYDSTGSVTQINEFDLFGYDFNVPELENVMQKLGALFLMKLHPLQKISDSSLRKSIANSKFIHLIDPDDPLEDVYEYLAGVDVLVTDYSSVLFDYLLLNRPVVFSAFDYEEQLNIRNFRFPYDEITPGPKVKNWPELIAVLELTLNGKDEWKKFREKVNNRFNYFTDEQSSKRVYLEIIDALNQ